MTKATHNKAGIKQDENLHPNENLSLCWSIKALCGRSSKLRLTCTRETAQLNLRLSTFSVWGTEMGYTSTSSSFIFISLWSPTRIILCRPTLNFLSLSLTLLSESVKWPSNVDGNNLCLQRPLHVIHILFLLRKPFPYGWEETIRIEIPVH